MTTLVDLHVGERAQVVDIEGIDDISLRLMEMGITPGVELKLVGSALFGDPIELELRGYHLSLRKSEACRVSIQRVT